MDLALIKKSFSEHFQGSGEMYASPGRINLIGEHTDYNGGFVFPGAIDKGMVAEIRKNGTSTIRAYSVDLKDYAEFGLEEQNIPAPSWARYIFGVCREMIKGVPCWAVLTLLLPAMCRWVRACLLLQRSKVPMLLP